MVQGLLAPWTLVQLPPLVNEAQDWSVPDPNQEIMTFPPEALMESGLAVAVAKL